MNHLLRRLSFVSQHGSAKEILFSAVKRNSTREKEQETGPEEAQWPPIPT